MSLVIFLFLSLLMKQWAAVAILLLLKMLPPQWRNPSAVCMVTIQGCWKNDYTVISIKPEIQLSVLMYKQFYLKYQGYMHDISFGLKVPTVGFGGRKFRSIMIRKATPKNCLSGIASSGQAKENKASNPNLKLHQPLELS